MGDFSKNIMFGKASVNGSVADAVILECLSDVEVVLAWGVMTGAGATSDTVKITDGTHDLTDTVDVSSKVDKAIFLFGTLDDAYRGVAAGTSLHAVNASGALVDVYLLAIPKNTP